MDIPAPTPLGSQPTVALGCVGGNFPRDLLREATDAGFAPVLQHHLLGEPGSSDDGPHEMLAATMRALGNAGHDARWGAGCAVGTTEEAALFATAGYTWFTFDLAGFIEDRAGSMSLDELDAAIVALEDAGCFSRGWHEAYLDREWRTASGNLLRLGDETLARVTVKFGRALAHADQLHQAIRTLWIGRGASPDVELNFSARRAAMSAEEFLFVALESARRGLNPVSIAPSLGPAWQPGAEFAGDNDALKKRIAPLGEIAALCGSLKLGIHSVGGKPGLISAARDFSGCLHLDCEEAAWLDALGRLADAQPQMFRQWLMLAQELFPFASGDSPLAITEEDTHALPEVPDAELREIFLGHVQGRQLLLTTFLAVVRRDRTLRDALCSVTTTRA